MVCFYYNYNIGFWICLSGYLCCGIISTILIIVGLTAILGFVSGFGKTLLDDQLNKLYSGIYQCT